jgi:hypothetical protein
MRVALAVLMLAASLAAEGATPSVILISVDTLRSDHLPAYGYRGIRTSQLDRFRADAVLFERAVWERKAMALLGLGRTKEAEDALRKGALASRAGWMRRRPAAPPFCFLPKG